MSRRGTRRFPPVPLRAAWGTFPGDRKGFQRRLTLGPESSRGKTAKSSELCDRGGVNNCPSRLLPAAPLGSQAPKGLRNNCWKGFFFATESGAATWQQERGPGWWEEYEGTSLCVFGHYAFEPGQYRDECGPSALISAWGNGGSNDYPPASAAPSGRGWVLSGYRKNSCSSMTRPVSRSVSFEKKPDELSAR